LATIFGVTGAWIGLLFIWKQSRSIEGQLSEMQEASRQTVALITQVSAGATASRLAAEAAINTERPWLVVSWEHDIKKAGSFLFGCLNQGRTPAKAASIYKGSN
jgi:hypothetical protein